MKVLKDRRDAAETEHVEKGAFGRRSILGGIAAVPVLYGIGAASSAQAATTVTRPGSTPSTAPSTLAPAVDGLARGVEHRYNAPQLAPGSRLVLPEGIRAAAVQDYYRHPRLASAETAWPRMTAADGSTVDASIVPEHGAVTRVGILSGFRTGGGWYELVLANNGTPRRVTWDAAKFPFLFIFGEFGAAADAPYNRFFTLALQPFSRNPYSRDTLAR